MIEKKITKEELVRDYTSILSNGYATIFLGAGMSMNSGLPAWKRLMIPIAKAMGQNIDNITDYYELAEQYVQVHGQRTPLTNILLQQIKQKFKPTDNHRIISRLPFNKIWTSNFDDLIEQAFEEVGKEVNVISRDIDFTFSRYEQVKLYKIHGCVYRTPEEIVITRRDIESYNSKYRQMQQAFENALSENTFLFLGFSFDDINFRTILGRLHYHFDLNQRQHYAILRKPPENSARSEYLKFSYAVNDLSNYGIRVLLVDNYEDISWILKDIERAFIRTNIFISGSLKKLEFNKKLASSLYGKEDVIEKYAKKFPYDNSSNEGIVQFLSELGYNLAKNNYKLYSGYGSGVCDIVIEGAAQHFVYQEFYQKVFDSLRVFPLPHRFSPLEKQNKYYREGMIGPCGFLIITRGNTANSDYLSGTMDEYTIAKGLSRLLLREQNAILRQIKNKSEDLVEYKVRQINLFKEKEIELMFLFNRLAREQWKLIIRLLDVINEQINNLYKAEGKEKKYKDVYLKVVSFISLRQELNFLNYYVNRYPTEKDEIRPDYISNLVSLFSELEPLKDENRKSKFNNYIKSIEKIIEAEKRYYYGALIIYLIEQIIERKYTNDFSKIFQENKTMIENHLKNLIQNTTNVSHKSLHEDYFQVFSKNDSTELLSFNKEDKVFIEIKKYHFQVQCLLDIEEDFERIKAQRQIMKVKDFRNFDDDDDRKYYDFEDYEKGIKSVHPFWYSVEDVDKIIQLHNNFIVNYLKVKNKTEKYFKITYEVTSQPDDFPKESIHSLCNEMQKHVDEISGINTNFQKFSYPFRCGTLILPIGCLGGMALKIWREERVRFVNRFASDERFLKELKSGKSIKECLIESYDKLARIKIEEDFNDKLLKEITFLIAAFSPSLTEYELNELAENYSKS